MRCRNCPTITEQPQPYPWGYEREGHPDDQEDNRMSWSKKHGVTPRGEMVLIFFGALLAAALLFGIIHLAAHLAEWLS
jgi:hypothetical protein